MDENKKNVNGFYLSFANWDILFQLDDEDLYWVLRCYTDFLKNGDWDKAYQDLNSGGQRCAFCFLCEHGKSGYEEIEDE